MSNRVTCINKSDRESAHERIRSIGGVNPDGTRWKRTQEQAIVDIETNTYRYHVLVNGSSADVIVAVSRFGNKYIKTTSDGEMPNNLLSLPECP